MSLRKMPANEFVRRLHADSERRDKRFAFFLGAGCSITSGIPGAASLVKDHWLPQLRNFCAPNEEDLDYWVKKEFPTYDPTDPASSYGPVMQELFIHPKDRQREIERLCEGKYPGFGYAVLASLVARDDGCFNVIITTNFDDLVSDALYLFTQARPLVIGHESLAAFIRPTRTRPLVVKIHGDARLSPQNTATETEKIQAEVESQVRKLLHDRALIFIGYGGNDHGIVELLRALPKEALPGGVYWISGSEPQCFLSSWLEERNAIWVEKFDFDEMMLLIWDVFNLSHPTQKLLDAMFERYWGTYKNLSSRILAAPEDVTVKTLKQAVDRADSDLSGWINIVIRAQRIEKKDPEDADRIYQEGLESYPNAASLLGAYAFFLEKIRKDFNQAEHLYRRSIEASPEEATIFVNFANFLSQIRNDYDQAEQYYLRAYIANPHHLNTLVNYAGFLLSHGNEEGVQLLEKAISFLPAPDFPDLEVKIWFYAFAHWTVKKQEALSKLRCLLQDGNRLPGWSWSESIDQARKESHPEIEWLEKLAAVINAKENITILDEWDKWKGA